MESTTDFYVDDFHKALFPLETNLVLIEKSPELIRQYIEQCVDPEQKGTSFLAQTRVYAAKSNFHLRRTVKLDFVAEYFLYDIVYRNKAKFRKPHSKTRRHFGYRFAKGDPLSPSSSYRGFKGAISSGLKKHKHALSFDVAAYFNGIYHHDLVAWIAELGATEKDVNDLGQFLREINSGRSIDCLPQGLYPSKMIGNDFLRFVDNHHALKNSELVRFMDDFYLFSDDEDLLQRDFIYIQKLLGDKGLSVNPNKTHRDTAKAVDFDNDLDEVKAALLKRRRYLILTGYDEDNNEVFKEVKIKKALTKEELAYLTKLLEQDGIEEEDAELVLTLMREHEHIVRKRLKDIIERFPHLSKNIFNFCQHVTDKNFLGEILVDILKNKSDLQEYQIFWFGWTLHSYLMNTPSALELIDLLYNHPMSTIITKAKILEIPDIRFGLTELRDGQLGAGQSDWLAWSAAVGHRKLKPITRNHKLTYFAKSSNINHLIYSILTGD